MPQYENPPGAPGATVINTTYHDAPVGPSGTHSIRYIGVDGAAATHTGYLDYSMTGTTLVIHTMQAMPQGRNLGSLLLFEACLRAIFHGLNRLSALNVAATARGFYLRSGFHPSRAESRNLTLASQQAGGFPFDIRLHLGRQIPTWDAQRAQVQTVTANAILGTWL